ncbi:LuxR C-terminal-related transcriptional regulator [Rathayibacter sp. VKM Ac-2926]|uniref:LuxR C-terminal-related transcriptional regulator n=1 Tax=Rathayibacter sp. VKM Ac-2926 TaxID=2929477 RepID=UPI001FB23F4C|nr:LuxR C-terminal-related transcriptional regulator [Rathayibacter sp. VKM Ac-2926]MCJ1705095.1 LuxR C-terminal-related transcriptional regulator [Rathayibacter sp. VKM Ac-2926]
MAEFEKFAVTVVSGLSIERAALAALLVDVLPHLSAADPDAAEADTIAVLDLDRVAPEVLTSTLAEVSARHRGLVVLSASDSLEAVRAVLRLERTAFVWKGDEPGELVAALVSVASGRSWISEAARHRFLAAGEHRRPVLSRQESRVMRSYGSGTAVKDVALDMRIAEHTVRTYIKRIKAKYLDAGIALESRVDFYRHLDGHDVAIRNGRDRVRPGLQETGGGVRGEIAS